MKNCKMDVVLCKTMDRSSHDLTGGQQSRDFSERGVYDWYWSVNLEPSSQPSPHLCLEGWFWLSLGSSQQHCDTVLASLKVPQTVLATSENPSDSCYQEMKLSQNFSSVLSQLSFSFSVFLCFCCKFPSKLFAHANVVYQCASSGLSVNYLKIPSLPRIKELLKALQSVCLTMTLMFSNNS